MTTLSSVIDYPDVSQRDFAREEWDRLCARPAGSLAIAELDRTITVGELIEQSRKRAGQLIAQGVTVGSRVIVARPNVIEYIVDYLATRLCGAIFINLPWSAGKSIVELGDILDAASVILTEHLVGDNPIFEKLGERRFQDVEAPIGPKAPPKRTANELGWFACTSGTTGTPKAAKHTYATFERQTDVFIERFSLSKDDPILVSSPVGHAVGLLFGVKMALALNAPMILVSRWRVETAVELIERYKCTFTAAPTPFLVDMVTYVEEHGTSRIQSLKYFPSSGAPVPAELKRRAYKAMPECEIWAYFGTSEAGAVTAVDPDATLDERLYTDGRALPGTSVRIRDGELEIHSPFQMMTGYWTGDHDNRLGEDGWYKTGDAAVQLDNGYISMSGRARDIILRGGENISPLETEDVLLRHPAITDVSIVGYPDDRLGSRLAAVIVPSEPVNLDDLCAHCAAAGLDKAKWPEFLTEIDMIPLSAIGKVRREIVEEYVLSKLNA